MKISLLILIGLYGLANLFASLFDLLKINNLPIANDIVLLISGLIFVLTFILVFKQQKHWFRMVIISIVIASAIAIFNERILGLGHPSHHIYRGIYTLIILVISYNLFKSAKQKSG